MEGEQIATAYHEAGHAVATWLFGYGSVIRRVSVIAEQDFLGVLEADSPLSNMEPEWDSAPEVSMALENDVVVLYSGPMAAKRSGMSPFGGYGGSKDFSDAAMLVGRLGGSIEHEEMLHKQLCQRAEVLVADHWSEIEAVAKALYQRKQLTGAEVVKVLETATGREIPRSPLFDYQRPIEAEF